MRVHGVKTFADVAPENPEMFDAFGQQVNTFMSVGIVLQYFRRKLL